MRNMPGLKLVMAVSHDGYVAKGPKDDMSWCPDGDKQLFRVMTGIGGVVGVGRVTAEVMPKVLPGRTIMTLSTSPILGMSLGAFAYKYPGAWLLGGQTIAMEALRTGLVDEVHLVRNPVELGEGVADTVTPWLWTAEGNTWHQAMETRMPFGSLEVEVWRRGT